MSNKENVLSEELIQYTIEQSKKLVNVKPTKNSNIKYPGLKPMIGFGKNK